jgi:hypothetical protein
MADITTIIGWSGDSLYDIDYVNKAYRGVMRNTSMDVDFVLFAGPEAQRPGRLRGIESGIRVEPSNYGSWWTGMQAANPDKTWLHTSSYLGIGLDCVIVGSLDDIYNYPSDRAFMKDYPSESCPVNRELDMNAEVSLYRNGSDRPIWDEYVRVGCPAWDLANIPSGATWRMGHQGWINETRALTYDLFPENWVISYKLGCQKGLPADCKIVSFHGKPKQRDVNDAWVKENWI